MLSEHICTFRKINKLVVKKLVHYNLPKLIVGELVWRAHASIIAPRRAIPYTQPVSLFHSAPNGTLNCTSCLVGGRAEQDVEGRPD